MTGRDAVIINIEGELVSLGPIRREDIPLYQRWINDIATSRMIGFSAGPMTLDQETTWYDAASRGQYTFAIYERATGLAIGTCSMHEIEWQNRRTTVGIMIGEPEARGRGYGTEAMRLLIDYAFTALGLHSVMLWVYEFNAAARRSYEKVGFREIGRRRECRWFNGRFWDEIAMDILASEFDSPVLAALLKPDAPRR